VALVTRDLDATMSFYRDVLGMEVVFILPAGELHGRHGAVRPGGELDRTGLHSHISLALPDEAAGLALRERLTRHGVETTPIMDQGPVRNMGSADNNGLLVEAAWPKL